MRQHRSGFIMLIELDTTLPSIPQPLIFLLTAIISCWIAAKGSDMKEFDDLLMESLFA
jgi:hypothetical protein